jgi:uncharacterized protein (TIGR02246 family)
VGRPKAAVVISLLLAGCAATAERPATPAAAQAEAVGVLRTGFVEAYRQGDAEAVAAFYAPDATYIGTGGDVVTGRDTLLIGLRREVPAFRDFRVVPAAFRVSGSLAYERGTYGATLTIPGRPPQPVSGPYLIVYERDAGGVWRIKAHMTARER